MTYKLCLRMIELGRMTAQMLDVYYAAGRLILDEAGGQAEALGHGTLMSGPAVKRGVIAAANPSLFAEWAAWIKTRS